MAASMCERFSITVESPELQETFQINKLLTNHNRRYNISPTQSIPIIVGGAQERKLIEARWGLFPFWAKDSVNADFDSVCRKRIFDRIVKRQRCVIPCSGFYGWHTEGKVNYAARIVVKDQDVFAMAGLYEVRVDPRGQLSHSATIVTTVPNRIVSQYNNRMPVILDNEERENWLNPLMVDSRILENHIYAYPASMMRVYPVTPLLRNDESMENPEAIAEYEPHLAMVKQ